VASRLDSNMICNVGGSMALKEAFPNLYGSACAKDASVVAHLEFSGGSN
jgi:hypothetical protein